MVLLQVLLVLQHVFFLSYRLEFCTVFLTKAARKSSNSFRLKFKIFLSYGVYSFQHKFELIKHLCNSNLALKLGKKSALM